jgi:hypothetical protein
MKVIRELEPEIKEIKEQEEEAEEEEEEQTELEEEEPGDEAGESELEESFEPTPSRNFPQFSRQVTPLLPTDEVQEIPTPELEQQLENVPGATTGEGEEIDYAPPEYETGYDVGDYERTHSADKDREMPSLLPKREEEREDIGIRKMDMGGWRRTMREPGMQRERIREDYSLKLRKAEEKEGLPFERKTKKRRLNI